MNINAIQTYNTPKIPFKSKQNPIAAFKIKTTHGILNVSEINFEKGISHRFAKIINKFFLKNFAENSKDEYYLDFKNGNRKTRKNVLKDMEEYYRDIFEDKMYENNITLLIAKDKNNKIQGACLSTSCMEFPGCFNTTLWVDALAVNRRYRREGIAETLMTKIIDANKNSYTDVFLTGSNFASKFYEKFGFTELDYSKPYQKEIIEHLKDFREDFPEHVKAYTYTLQPDKPRWYIKVAKALRQLDN